MNKAREKRYEDIAQSEIYIERLKKEIENANGETKKLLNISLKKEQQQLEEKKKEAGRLDYRKHLRNKKQGGSYDDEWYTYAETAKKHLEHFKTFIKNKTIILPFDSNESNYTKEANKIKQECGCVDVLNFSRQEDPYYDFFTSEKIKNLLLKNENIVIITNPPFSCESAIIDYITQLNPDVPFCFMCNLLFLTTKNIFLKIKEHKLNAYGTSALKFYNNEGDTKGVPVCFITNIDRKYQEKQEKQQEKQEEEQERDEEGILVFKSKKDFELYSSKNGLPDICYVPLTFLTYDVFYENYELIKEKIISFKKYLIKRKE